MIALLLHLRTAGYSLVEPLALGPSARITCLSAVSLIIHVNFYIESQLVLEMGASSRTFLRNSFI